MSAREELSSTPVQLSAASLSFFFAAHPHPSSLAIQSGRLSETKRTRVRLPRPSKPTYVLERSDELEVAMSECEGSHLSAPAPADSWGRSQQKMWNSLALRVASYQ